MNPLLATWKTQFGIPPFGEIHESDFAPAFEQAFAKGRAAINAIATNPAKPTFDNTIAEMERADALLEKIGGVFFNLTGTDSTEALEALERDLSPKFAAHSSETLMNTALFARVQAVVDGGEKLDTEQERVLTLYHRMFVRAGAQLKGSKSDRLKAIMERLAALGTAFSQNVLADERGWSLDLSADDLQGLPDDVIASTAEAAKQRGKSGNRLTLSRSVVVPFLQFSPRRDLRERAFKAWVARGANGGKSDNSAIVAETLALRQERAELLGYENFAQFRLEPEMARTPDAVREMLMTVWAPAKAQALRDEDILSQRMHADGINGDLEPWDWRYYSEARRKAEFDLDEAVLKPYFQLEKMIEAAFACASRLFGLTFHSIEIALYHADAQAWEVRKGNRHIGIFIGDYFARTSKRSGAWCSRFRAQAKLDGEVRPIVTNVCNFAKAPDGQPNLLTYDDARTLFHEFGHALHSLLSDVTYAYISGTNTATDFVELPSQLYEHWLSEKPVLAKFALHAETGKPMSDALLEKLLAAANYDQGFSTVEYLSSALVDLNFHTSAKTADPMVSQAAILNVLGMPKSIKMRHGTPHFQHVFSGDGYASAYYSYMWSEMMDADAFAAFKETGDIFDRETAARLEKHILSAGSSQDEAALYLAFRGKMPGVGALLKQRGFYADQL